MPKNSVADKNRRTAGKQLSFNFSIKDERFPKLIGLLCLFISLYLFIAFTSYLFTWYDDQSHSDWSSLFNSEKEMTNWLGRLGAIVSHTFIWNGFGIPSYIFVLLTTYTGIYLVMGIDLMKLISLYRKAAATLLWSSVLFAFVFQLSMFPWGGAFGIYVFIGLNALVGTAGIIVIMLFALMAVLVWNRNPDFNDWTKDKILESLHPKAVLQSFRSYIQDLKSTSAVI